MGTDVVEQKKELTLEERKDLYDKLRARMAVSKLKAEGPVNRTGYWARKDDATEMARLELLGFSIVRELTDKPKRWKAQGTRADGTYVMGDVILMEIPTIEYEFYLQQNTERAKAMPEAAKQKFVESAEKQGAPTFKLQRKG